MSGNREFWISELNRLRNRCTEALDANQAYAAEELMNNFDEMLSNLKKEYPDNDVINSTGHFSGTLPYYGRHDISAKLEVLYLMSNNCERIAQSLNVDLKDDDSKTQNYEPLIDIDNSQNVNQNQRTKIDISTQIENSPLNQELKDELHELKEDFRTELNSDNPDKTKLRRFLKDMKDYSIPVAANMAIEALQMGLFAVLDI